MRIAIIVAFVLSSIASAQTAGDYFLYQWDGTKNVKVYTTTFPAAAHNQAWSTITSTPTTLSGYGITDALTSSSSLSADNISSGSLSLARIAQSSATSGQALAWNGTAWAPTTISASGSVTIGASSVSLGGTLTTLTSLTNLGVSMANNTAMTGFALGTISDTTARPLAITQTWNNASLVGEAVSVDVTDTASGTGSALMNLKVGGTSKFKIDKSLGITKLGAYGPNDVDRAVWSDSMYWLYIGNYTLAIRSVNVSSLAEPVLRVPFGIGITNGYANGDRVLDLLGASLGVLQLGASGTTAVNQSIQAMLTTGTNAAGAHLRFYSGNGTGTGGSGDVEIYTASAGSTGTTANTMTLRMKITKDGKVIFYNLPTSPTGLATGTIYNDAGTAKFAP